ncbi:MAG: response regulator [bacterium]|nr:response regulator [bacterium]
MAGEHVLIVEDDEDTVKLLRNLLKKETFQLSVAEDGNEALRMAKNLQPHIILLDIIMAGLNGFQVCEKLKNNFYTSHIPIIMLTIKESTFDRIKGLEIGADDYIAKPFDPKELVARIRAVLRRTHLERDVNPLTGLPGNIMIEKEIKRRIESGELFAVLYADIDNFKAYNDYYGYSLGDRAIKFIGDVILSSVEGYGNESDFVGHIGGDDFIIVTTPDKTEPICKNIIGTVESTSSHLYEEEDRKRGYIEVKNRWNETLRFNTRFEITIASATNKYRRLSSHVQVSDILASVKEYGKAQKGSIWVEDKRRHEEVKK